MKFSLLTLVFVVLVQGCAGQSQLIEDRLETVVIEDLRYYLYFPENYESKVDEKFPLLLFLHGGGEAGVDSLGILKENGPPKLIAQGKQFPFLILAPQNPHKKKYHYRKQ